MSDAKFDALLAQLEAETDPEARARAIDVAIARLTALRDGDAVARHTRAVREALRRLCEGEAIGAGEPPALDPADVAELERLADALTFVACTYAHGGDGTITSRVEGALSGRPFTATWRYNYERELSEWALRGALASDGQDCFFGEAHVRAEAGLTTLSPDTLRLFAYLCAFDHLHGDEPHAFYHRPAWD